MLRRIYHWILSWANHPWGTAILAVLAFLDSFVFPIPPLFLQIALSIERPKRSFWYAFVDTAASVLGSIVGYWIGYALWDTIGVRIVGPLPEALRAKLQDNAFMVTLLYSFIPLPYKFITLGSGLLHLNLATLLIASTLGRSGRFFLLGAICFFAGTRAKEFIERYFNRLCLALGMFLALLAVYAAFFVRKPAMPAEAAALRPRVEASTGWSFETAPAFETIDRKGFERFLDSKLTGEEGRRLEAGGRAFRVLGLLPRNYSILDAVKRMYAEEVLALYDPKLRKVLLVREALEKPGRAASERELTIAHEMVHALQHQHDPNFGAIESEDPDLDDAKGALHAVMEGEATVQQYAIGGAEIAPAFYARVLSSLESNASGKFAAEPAVLKRVLYFPYIAGTAWISARAPSGIQGAAPGLRATEPLSTEHLLHPERTIAGDPPLAVFLPDLSKAIGGDRKRVDEGVLGEKFLSALLEAGAGPSTPLDPALRWGGDRLQLYEKPDGTAPVVVLVTAWDTSSSALLAFARLLSKEGFAVELEGKQVAAVAGLPPDEGLKAARESLSRSVVAPFRTLEELKRARKDLVLPEPPRPLAGSLGTADAAISEAPGKDALKIPRFAEILKLLEKSAARDDVKRLRDVLKP